MYMAILEQDDEGCGHTIGCGTVVVELEALSIVKALAELKKIVIGTWDEKLGYFDAGYGTDEDDERALKSAMLIYVNYRQTPDIKDWYREAAQIIEAHKKGETDDAERRQYDRLKLKFGGE